jgi:SAM-dependent methyltransferase
VIEPYRTQFVDLIRAGAAQGDIHGVDAAAMVNEGFIRRELDRVNVHQRSLIPLLRHHGVSAGRVLDVGCSTGGTTAALASWYTDGDIVGVDVNPASIAAAKVRLQGLGMGNAVADCVAPGPLPYPDASFDLVTCVSVLEFVPEGRGEFLAELQRVVRPGGHVYVSTPNPWVLRELHSRRWLGNQRRRADYPWASTRSAIAAGLDRCEAVSTDAYVARRWRCPEVVARVMPWQKLLFRRG